MGKKILALSILVSLLSFSVKAQSTEIYFYRLKNLVAAGSNCMIALNDTLKFTLANGSYHKVSLDAKSVEITSSMTNIGIKKLDLQKGKTYYIEADVQSFNKVNFILRDENSGKAAIDRFEADEKVKDLDPKSLPVIKVTEIAPIPSPDESVARIYLYHPFNLTVINSSIKVSDGKTFYDMRNNSAHVISTTESSINLMTAYDGHNSSNTSINLNLEKGKVYYVAIIRTVKAVVLRETPKEYAVKEMKL